MRIMGKGEREALLIQAGKDVSILIEQEGNQEGNWNVGGSKIIVSFILGKRQDSLQKDSHRLSHFSSSED